MDVDSDRLKKLVDDQEKLLGVFSHMLKHGGGHGSSRARGRDSDRSGFFSDMRKDWDDSHRSAQKFDRTLAGAAGGVASSFKLLTRDVSGAITAFQGLAKGLFGETIGGVLIGGLTSYTTGLVSTYKDLAEHGQNFSDGIFGMAKAAMAGQVSLEEYSRMAKRNSTVMAQMGSKNGGFAGLAAEVRKNSESAGMFGYTIEGLNDLVGDYMETQRIQGRLDKVSKQEAAQNLLTLAQDTTMLSAVFGKSRREITDTAQGVMRSASATIALGTMSADQAKKFGPAIETAVTTLSAQAGEAGKMLPKFLVDTIAAGGQEVFTETGRLMNKLLPSTNGLTAGLAKRIEAAGNDDEAILRATNDYNKQMKDAYESQKDNLQIYHMAGGEIGAQADAIISMMSSIKVLSEDELKEAIKKKQITDKFTKVMSSLENKWARFSTGLLEKLFPMLEKPLEAIGAAFDKFEKSGGADLVATSIARLGTVFGNFVNNIVTPERMKALTDKVNEWMDDFAHFLDGMASIDGKPTATDGKDDPTKAGVGFIAAITMVKDALVALATPVLWVKEKMDQLGIGMKEAAELFLVWKGGKALFSGFNFLKNVFRMTVSARNVYVNGEGGGLFNRGGRDHHSRDRGPHDHHHNNRGGGRRGWFGKMFSFLSDHADDVATVAGIAGDALESKGAPSVGGAAGAAAEGAAGAAAGGGGIKGWFKGLAGSFKGIGGLGKGLGIAGAVLDGWTLKNEVGEAWDKYQKGGEGSEFTKSLITSILPRVTGWMGSIVGGSLGTLGGAITGPGAVVTGGIGMIGGYQAGAWGGRGVAEDLNKVVDWLTKPNSPAVLSENTAQTIQTTQNSVMERLTNLDRQAQADDPNAKKSLELLQALVDGMKDGTGINAAFLQKVADAVSQGTRRLGSTIQSQSR